MCAKLILLQKNCEISYSSKMNFLDFYTKKNIYDYSARSKDKYEKKYLKEKKEIRSDLIRQYKQQKKIGGTVDSKYLISYIDFF